MSTDYTKPDGIEEATPECALVASVTAALLTLITHHAFSGKLPFLSLSVCRITVDTSVIVQIYIQVQGTPGSH